jgi:serine-type D-Ala-D-Ala carboxypeptidase/endopeptidase (penicillin-binding protein 4)
VANQVFLEMGAKRFGAPVSLEKSVAVARTILAEHGLADAIQLEEGSGLSRGNRFTARGLAQVLSLFAPHIDLLENRKADSYKTGTLEGVRTVAGYIRSTRHGLVRFVIALKGNNGALRFELLQAIESEL